MRKNIIGTCLPLSNAEEGSAAVEFALILPILILLLFGIVEFSRGFNAYLLVTHAAREGARLASIGKYDESEIERRAYPLKRSDGLSISKRSNGDMRGAQVEVEVSYPFRLYIPLFGDRTITIKSIAVTTIE